MKTSEPCTLAIFGAGGNLSCRKLIPALFRPEMAKRLPEQMVIPVATSRCGSATNG
jgi:glucose-6-phosphate 1-dehydrogenase